MPLDDHRRPMKWNQYGGGWIEDPTAQPKEKKPYEYRDTGSSSVRAGNPYAKSSVPPLPTRAIEMTSVRVGMKEAPHGGGVCAPAALQCAEEESVADAAHAYAPAVSRDSVVVWESPEPRVVEPDPDLYSIDVTLRRHGMYHGANMTTDHEDAMHFALGRLRRWSI